PYSSRTRRPLGSPGHVGGASDVLATKIRSSSNVAPRLCSTEFTDALAQCNHISADAVGVHTVVALTLSAGRAHIDAGSGLVANDPDDDVVCKTEPTALLTCLNAACINIEGNDDPTRHRFRDVKGFVERPRHGQLCHDRG